MVRFIIGNKKWGGEQNGKIYIPIWLDLLYEESKKVSLIYENLHSNMVRFIIQK